MRIGSDRTKKNEASVDESTTTDDQHTAPSLDTGAHTDQPIAPTPATGERTDETDERIPNSGVPVGDAGAHRAPSAPTPDTGEPLLAVAETERLRMQWREVQGMFVDSPQDAVTRADELVDGTIRQLVDTYTDRRKNLQSRWSRDESGDTEELRQAMRGYRAFFDQLLSTGG